MPDLPNFYQITEYIGTGGQPSRDQLAMLAEEDYAAVVNLSMHDEEAIPDEGHIVSSLGLSYFHIPVPFDSPTPAHVRRFFDVMEVLEGQKVLVHCAVNGRVSAFMHQYLTLKKGQGTEESTTPLLEIWRPHMDEPWQAIMDLDLKDIE